AQSGLKVVRLDHPDLASPVYVKQSSSIHARLQAPLVLHPQYEAVVQNLLLQPGIARGHTRYYHNTNLRGFPKRRNGGASDIAYGVDVGFHNSAALLVLVDELLDEPRPLASNSERSADLARVLPEDIALTDTERDALIKARVGQSGYRDELLGYWGGCAVTDCCVPTLLRASHIKPWRAASGAERLDKFNGLLLTPNLDLAFDQGLISFDDHGQILLGEDLDPDSARALNITSDLRLRQIDARHREYLAWHRDNLFRK
ncbi:MAG TPA: HNH endonuclease, partial [Pseudomonas sp.]|nr:HNH endonuclease [Pseudomonas sp.]